MTYIWENGMADDHVYRVIEITGSSTKSIEDAIQVAVARASKTLRQLRWFEVVQTRGHLDEGKIQHYQVTLKIGFTIDDGDDVDGLARWRGPISRCGPRCPKANASASTTGTKPTTCPGRCAPSRRAVPGAAGAARDPGEVHVAFYEFDSVEAAEAATAPDKIAPLVADFDRVWGDRVTRRRAILDVVQEIGP